MLGGLGRLEGLKAWLKVRRLVGLAAWRGSLTRSTLGEVGGLPVSSKAPGTPPGESCAQARLERLCHNMEHRGIYML